MVRAMTSALNTMNPNDSRSVRALARILVVVSQAALPLQTHAPVSPRFLTRARARVWWQVRDSVAVHVPCSSKKMGLSDAFTQVASLCAHEVTHTGVPCCGAPL